VSFELPGPVLPPQILQTVGWVETHTSVICPA